MKRAVYIAAIALCSAAAFFLQRRAAPASSSSAAADGDLIVAGLGGFRGLVSEVVWFRADRLQEDGRYGELAQLASWLTLLEPHTPEVWAYSAWNLAYNVSVMMPTPADRWRWVQAGLRLLRDDGLSYNPGNPELCREIAWLFMLKIGAGLDAASAYYRDEWKALVQEARTSGDWSSLRMDPEKMRAVDDAYGAQDWTNPLASALYWAREGLPAARNPDRRRDLRQIVYQTLAMEARADARFAPSAIREMESFYKEWPHPVIKDAIEKFRATVAAPLASE